MAELVNIYTNFKKTQYNLNKIKVSAYIYVNKQHSFHKTELEGSKKN